MCISSTEEQEECNLSFRINLKRLVTRLELQSRMDVFDVLSPKAKGSET